MCFVMKILYNCTALLSFHKYYSHKPYNCEIVGVGVLNVIFKMLDLQSFPHGREHINASPLVAIPFYYYYFFCPLFIFPWANFLKQRTYMCYTCFHIMQSPCLDALQTKVHSNHYERMALIMCFKRPSSDSEN